VIGFPVEERVGVFFNAKASCVDVTEGLALPLRNTSNFCCSEESVLAIN
jgi:hypothetical protein